MSLCFCCCPRPKGLQRAGNSELRGNDQLLIAEDGLAVAQFACLVDRNPAAPAALIVARAEQFDLESSDWCVWGDVADVFSPDLGRE